MTLAVLSRIYHRILDVPKRGLPNFRQVKVGDEFDGYKFLTAPFSRNFGHGFRYEPIHPEYVYDILRMLNINFPEYSFIDIGCGKGRPLKIASEFGFKTLIGVEYSRSLAEHAISTITSLRLKHAEIFVMDAAEYKFPNGPLVVFMYNPFDQVVLAKMMANLLEVKCDVILIYLGLGKDWPGKWMIPWKHSKDAVIYRRECHA